MSERDVSEEEPVNALVFEYEGRGLYLAKMADFQDMLLAVRLKFKIGKHDEVFFDVKRLQPEKPAKQGRPKVEKIEVDEHAWRTLLPRLDKVYVRTVPNEADPTENLGVGGLPDESLEDSGDGRSYDGLTETKSTTVDLRSEAEEVKRESAEASSLSRKRNYSRAFEEAGIDRTDTIRPDTKIEWNKWSSSMENFQTKIRHMAGEELDNKQSKRSIYGVIKFDPLHFSGIGTQEGCNLLIHNFIHPLLPLWVVCSSDELWGRLLTGIVTHFDMATETALELPHVSSEPPLRMMSMVHKKFLDSSVLCYKRSRVFKCHSWLDQAMTEFNLFDANTVLNSDGKGQFAQTIVRMFGYPLKIAL
ncbi:hypothetical protein V5O48_006365 [Marasmius crinis-equi]|uniref:Uncharacterized protein n=1 Tax=Marasmius crinis-equi TaxID=585013 RepID=A0ABR3FJP1_9AGAR